MTVNFNADGDWQERMKVGGGPAESAFVDFAIANEMSIERYGFDNTPMKGFHYLPMFVRVTPDFVATKKSKGYLVECKGTGRGDTVNIKIRDIEPLKFWSEVSDLYIFANDSYMNRISFMPYEELYPHIDRTHTFVIGQYGTKFHGIPKSAFEWKSK